MEKLCVFILFTLLTGSSIASDIDCKSIYTKPPMDSRRLSRYQIKKLPISVQKTMLRNYSSTVQGCMMPATSVFGAYSPYEDGLIVFMCGKVDAAAYRADRVALQDAIEGKVSFEIPSPKLVGECVRSKPTIVHYPMPTTLTP